MLYYNLNLLYKCTLALKYNYPLFRGFYLLIKSVLLQLILNLLMQNSSILTNEGLKHLTQAIDKILASVQDLISVTEDIIPESLSNNGLIICLSNLCQSLQTEKKIKIKTTNKGETYRLDNAIELTIYKIFNALITVLLSQKEVSNMSVLFFQTKETFSFTILFDGRDFTLSGISSSEIIEIAKIKSQIESLNGSFTLHQNKKNSTEVKVDVKY